VGLYNLALAVRTHLGSIELSHGLFLGKWQLMILTSSPPFLTPRLSEVIHPLTSLEMC